MIKDSDDVLDVGGELNHLSQFCKPKKIIVANLNTGDVIIKGNKLPFKNNSYSVVCAIDVLEHINKKNRKMFIKELIRVAAERVVLSFPIGTQKHIRYEKELEKQLESKGQNVLYLKEHIKFGLPKNEEIEELFENNKGSIKYSGQLFINKILFNIFMFDPKVKFLRKVIYFSKNLFNLITNPIFYLFLSNINFSENAVRAYILINKNEDRLF